ncbi:GNAT family N-acetyltransferase [Streptomyces sp. CC224B]|uniref:GNAT family N-acetyltransferase n=1 Tax=Streptomyces sp. CC224B TaxID=3044571 RepID=UPI0024A913E4|nr:GNAT family N-acetyltransferase [Streptomyces sp. CC224B]
MTADPVTLVPFAPEHAPAVAAWARSVVEAVLWCGEYRYPVTGRAVAGWCRGSGVRARLLVAGGRPVGYGELWPDEAEDEVEPARIIVAPRERGRGLGRTLVRALFAEARGTGLRAAFLRVHPANTPALACSPGSGLHPGGRRGRRPLKRAAAGRLCLAVPPAEVRHGTRLRRGRPP